MADCEQGTHHRVHPGVIVVEPGDVVLAAQLEEAGEGGMHHDDHNHTRCHQCVLLAEGLAGVVLIICGSWVVGLVEAAAQPWEQSGAVEVGDSLDLGVGEAARHRRGWNPVHELLGHP